LAQSNQSKIEREALNNFSCCSIINKNMLNCNTFSPFSVLSKRRDQMFLKIGCRQRNKRSIVGQSFETDQGELALEKINTYLHCRCTESLSWTQFYRTMHISKEGSFYCWIMTPMFTDFSIIVFHTLSFLNCMPRRKLAPCM
jgi:hypothetical protein